MRPVPLVSDYSTYAFQSPVCQPALTNGGDSAKFGDRSRSMPAVFGKHVSPASVSVQWRGGASTMNVKCLHHINFIVRDLEAARECFEAFFGARFQAPEDLPQRGVRLARIKISEIWVVLVQPTDPTGAPARHLEQYGEGFYLASWKVDDVQESVKRLSTRGIAALNRKARAGLDDWRVVDLDPEALNGVAFQVVQSGN